MNIYEKINLARIKFQQLNIKMGGENTFAKYSYYELGDILPHMNLICAEIGLCNIISFSPEVAIMTIVNIENPEENILVTSPMSTASLKGCHEVQNLGAVETYIRRYLYQTAYEIVESDVLNKTQNPNEQPAKNEAVDSLKDKKMTDEDYRKYAWDLLFNSTMKDETKKKWMDAYPKLTMPAIHNLVDMIQGAKK